ncbi:uncharacterized protein Ho [Planococcus citri]|uniref:uncharacterized protein Ho n=1 Tax=Planococcus citri TaxID=170843 RepID=UPI0031F7A7C7
MDSNEPQFTVQMRKATRQVHSLSDALVQSKFVFGLIDDRVWAEGLLVFYEVFRYLEEAMDRLPNTNVGKFKNESLMRTKYFETDLETYYGKDWRTSQPSRECVRKYVEHLETLEQTEPDLLIAYIYHLYLGLLSGGRILRKKQKVMAFSRFSKQSTVVDFDAKVVSEMKKFIKDTTNEIAENLDEKAKQQILDESVTVFKLNCDIIRSVDSAQHVVNKAFWSVVYIGLALFAMIALYMYRTPDTTSEK